MKKHSSDNTTWEYKAFKYKAPKKQKWIDMWNDLGSQGWEYVGNFEDYFIFKRPANN